jgi:hypothetical protein
MGHDPSYSRLSNSAFASQFVFDICNCFIIEGEFALQHTIRYALSLLEEGDDLVHNLNKRHVCASPAGIIGESCGEE